MSKEDTFLISFVKEELQTLLSPTNSHIKGERGVLKWVSLCLLIVFSSIFVKKANSQIVLQLEKVNQVKTYKYIPGNSLIIMQKDFPDVWTKKQISEILVQENTIVFEDLITPLDGIIGVRHENGTIKALSKKLNQFGVTWLAFAGILHVLDRFDVGTDTFVVAGSAFAIGYGIKALFFRKTFTIGKNSRLRILDLNMYKSNFD